MNYWIVRGKPTENNLPAIIRKGQSGSWRTRRPPSAWEPGDRIFFYASSPQKEIVALGEFRGVTSKRRPDGDTRYGVRYLSDYLANRPTCHALRADRQLQGASFLKHGPAMSVLRLSMEHGERLYWHVCQLNPKAASVWRDAPPTLTKGASRRSAGELSPFGIPQSGGIPDVDEINGGRLFGVEGASSLRQHLVRERDRALVAHKKRALKAKGGALICEVCAFDFSVFYGLIGADYCEIHHRVPLGAGEGKRTTRLEHLAVVCSNCHRMLHRGNPVLSIEELREHIRIAGQSRGMRSSRQRAR